MDGGTRFAQQKNAAGTIQLKPRQNGKTSRTPLDEGLSDFKVALSATARFVLDAFFFDCINGVRFSNLHTIIRETKPPIAKAPIQVPIQMIMPSLKPRSFIITINEAMQGTKSVMVMRATVTCIGSSCMW